MTRPTITVGAQAAEYVTELMDSVEAGLLGTAQTVADGHSVSTVGEAHALHSHVQWVASRVADIADELRTHAQLRVEDRVDQLVDLRNQAEPVIDAAEAVVAAARRVEEIEKYIAALRRIAGNLDTPADEEEDEGQDAAPAGDCDA